MAKQLTTFPDAPIIEKVMMEGDLSGLTTEQRLAYYKSVCETLKLNPITKPFEYITLDKKLVLYATKDCAAQLRKKHRISIKITSREQHEGVYVVTVNAWIPTSGYPSTENGPRREDEAIGAVPTTVTRDGETFPITAASLANAIMKAETKAKRRVTLSICGLGMLDESEIEDRDMDQRSPNEIAERNVRQATANATGETAQPLSTSIKLTTGEVTKDNWREVVVHVGKDDGMKWKKVGELDRNVIEWMYNKWRNNLTPSASVEDLRLKKAIEFAYTETVSGDAKTGDGQGAEIKPIATGTPVAQQPSAKEAAIADLLGRIQDLVLTEEQAVKYCIENGIANEGTTRFDQMKEQILLYLCTPKGWSVFKGIVEQAVRPKPKWKGQKK
jgi:hypothetical protein